MSIEEVIKKIIKSEDIYTHLIDLKYTKTLIYLITYVSFNFLCVFSNFLSYYK